MSSTSSLLRTSLLVAAVTAVGCVAHNEEWASRRGRDVEGTHPGQRVVDPRFPETRARLNNAALTDDALVGRLAVEATNARRTATDTLEVWAELRNRTDHPMQVECRVLWFDQDEAQVESPSAWQRLYLDGNSRETCRETSTRVAGLAYYSIEIREAR
jgi:uncharacterized protein YcfL